MTNAVPAHMGSVLYKLMECGARVSFSGDAMRFVGPKRPRELKLVETQPHPGFPTDMQAQMFALLSVASGVSMIVENVFESRFKHGAELMRMGADCTIKDRTAVIRGVERLMGTNVDARDLRCGAALVLAGLRAEGITTVHSAELIDRGYEALERDLKALGANIERRD